MPEAKIVMDILFFMSIVAHILVPALKLSIAVDTIRQFQSITDDTTLVSQGGSFELGFFSPGNSDKRYLGIWYKNIPVKTYVWVANGLNPINDSSGIILAVNSTGNLVLRQNETVVWYTTSQMQVQNPVAQLLDSGNLVVRDENEANPDSYLWQSFDFPSDTSLPGMKLGWDLRRGRNWRMTSWKSPDDPSPGNFSWDLLLHNYPEFYLMKGTEKFCRIGPWNGLYFSGLPDLKSNPVYDFKYVSNKDEIFYTYSLKSNSVISRLVMNESDSMCHRYVWVEDDKNWRVYKSLPRDYCDNYGLCGANGNCIITESPVCQCLEGFSPKSPQKWNSMDWSQGCVRNKPLSCIDNNKDVFIKLADLKVPEATNTLVDETIGLEQCREKCLSNCSCMAYTNLDIRGAGSGCVMWFGDLIDIRQFPTDGQDLYIRMAASELEAQQGSRNKSTLIVAISAAAIPGILLVGCFFGYKVWRNITVDSENIDEDQNSGGNVDDVDLPLLDLSTIAIATDNFSIRNKIGEGGFGPVYRGQLTHGQQIAVKRLSGSSGQGITEFKNEVKLIAKLQHRNLVKLLGCCIQGEDKMLVYEYMPNNSLDYFIFDHNKAKLLDWSKRYHIICGIARGLLYLHQDSRLRIIHRDLKASNILLDDKLNPKISDFGIARMFGGDLTEVKTKRIVGTYGYMAPEYVADGLFSVKSDVFSFGILLLEIICGKRSRGFYHSDHSLNLIGHGWRLWKEGRASELIDTNIEDSCILSEVLRCIHVGLLCVQQFPEDRPTMSSIVVMLGSDNDLAEPKMPGFFPRNDFLESQFCSTQKNRRLSNEITITLVEAR